MKKAEEIRTRVFALCTVSLFMQKYKYWAIFSYSFFIDRRRSQVFRLRLPNHQFNESTFFFALEHFRKDRIYGRSFNSNSLNLDLVLNWVILNSRAFINYNNECLGFNYYMLFLLNNYQSQYYKKLNTKINFNSLPGSH